MLRYDSVVGVIRQVPGGRMLDIIYGPLLPSSGTCVTEELRRSPLQWLAAARYSRAADVAVGH